MNGEEPGNVVPPGLVQGFRLLQLGKQWGQEMNTVITAVVGIGMIVLCVVSMWAIVREMRALCAYERDTMNMWRKQTRLARLALDDAQQAKYWAEADAMIEGARR